MLLELSLVGLMSSVDDPTVDLQVGVNRVQFATATAAGLAGQGDNEGGNLIMPNIRGSVGLYHFRVSKVACSVNLSVGYRLGGTLDFIPSQDIDVDPQVSAGFMFRGEPLSADWSFGYGLDYANDVMKFGKTKSSSDLWRVYHKVEFRYHFGKSRFWKAQPYISLDVSVPHGTWELDSAVYYYDFVGSTGTHPLGNPYTLPSGTRVDSFTDGHLPQLNLGFSVGVRSGNRWWR